MSVDSSSELFSVNVGNEVSSCIGLLDGNGSASYLSWEDTAKWFVIESNDIVALDGRYEVSNGIVVACGTRKDATDFLISKGGTGVHGAFHMTGNYGTSTSGYIGTSTSGYKGTSISGDSGTSTSGYKGTSISGDSGTSTSGFEGTSTSGDCGTSTSGYGGTSTSGRYGTSTSGYRGTSMSGDGGNIVINYYDGNRCRIKTGYIGENGLLPNVPYRLNSNHEFEIDVERALPMESVSIDVLMPYMAQVIQFEDDLLKMERTPRIDEILEFVHKYKPLVA
jgi:hypothetical protein